MVKVISIDEFNAVLSCIYKNKFNSYYTDKIVKHILPAIENAISTKLTERQRECFILYYRKSKNIYEIASLLKLSTATISVHIKKAKQNIYESIKYFVPPKERFI